MEMVDRAVAMADRKAVGVRNSRADEHLGVAQRRFQRLSLRESCRDRC